MNNNTKIYRPKKSFLGGVFVVFLIVFLGLTLPHFITGTIERHEALGLSVFYTFIIALSLVPFISWLEVGNTYVKFYFLGYCIRNLHASDIQVLEYGNLMRWGSLGYGKGLKGWEKTKGGGIKYFSLGENFYGKEAIGHVRQVLDPQHR